MSDEPVKPEPKGTEVATWKEPWAMVDEMERDLERFWDRRWPVFPRLWGRLMRRSDESSSPWAPRIDVYTSEDKLVVKADLPGIDKDAIEVQIENGDLVVQGERHEETEVKEDSYYRSERRFGSFYRRIPLPEGTDTDKIDASFNNGVLMVTVPLPVEVKPEPKKIAVS